MKKGTILIKLSTNLTHKKPNPFIYTMICNKGTQLGIAWIALAYFENLMTFNMWQQLVEEEMCWPMQGEDVTTKEKAKGQVGNGLNTTKDKN